MSELIIRNATIDDLDDVSSIELRCFPEAEAATYEALKDRLSTFPESFFIGEIDGSTIGFINGCVTDEANLPDELYHDLTMHNPDGPYQTVFGLDVLPEYQHRGYASQLMNHLIQISQKRNKKRIILTCKDHLIGFYESFGYKHLGVSNSTHGDAKWNDMLLEF